MRRPRILEPDEAEGFNLTPMIDITFQLIIFFMLVTEMAEAQITDLTLPSARKAAEEKFVDDTTLILNVIGEDSTKPNGTILIDGKVVFTPPAGAAKFDVKRLMDIFEQRRQMKAYQETAGDDTHVKYPILIRADRTAHFEWVQLILTIASHHGGVTRVQMGAKQESEKP